MKLKPKFAIGILIFFYTIGLVGMFTPYRSVFEALTPWNLLLSFVVFLTVTARWTWSFVLDILLLLVVSFGFEWVGVHTGWLFGNYSYGPNLGYKLDGIPLLIAVNWVMLTFGTASLVKRLKISSLFQQILAATLMTGLDFLLEPVAMRSGYWKWENNHVPLYNYICWFVFAFIFQYWIHSRKSVQMNKVWSALFVIMVLFFAILN